VLHVNEDAWQGNAQFTVTVDGHQVGGTQTANVTHASGQWQDVTLTGSFGSGAHDVKVTFLNDAWSGKPGEDRNLYVNGLEFNGVHYDGAASLQTTGASTTIKVGAASPTPAPTPAPTGPVIATPDAKPTPGGEHGYVVPDASGTATGTAGADDLFATGAHETLIGNGGNDVFHLGSYTDAKIVVGATGTSTVSSWAPAYTLADGVDNLTLEGSYAHQVTGNAKANYIVGGDGKDVIDGGAGNDTLVVGTGANKLTGGTGQDLFVFGKAADHDNVITDFHLGEDMLDLRAAVKDAGYTGANAVADHVLSVAQVGANAVITIDPDGNGNAAGHVLATLNGVQAAQLKAGIDYLWH
jgi:Ca2+-binding RTX toxin-like protein